MDWKHDKTLMENVWLRVDIETDEDSIQKRIVARYVDEPADVEPVFILPGFPMLFDMPPGVWTSLAREIKRNVDNAYKNGFDEGREDVFKVSARLNGADVIANRLTEALGLSYDKNGYRY